MHPDLQYALMSFIIAFAQHSGSTVLITTHSPYIMLAANNMYYAGYLYGQGNFKSNGVPKKLKLLTQKLGSTEQIYQVVVDGTASKGYVNCDNKHPIDLPVI